MRDHGKGTGKICEQGNIHINAAGVHIPAPPKSQKESTEDAALSRFEGDRDSTLYVLDKPRTRPGPRKGLEPYSEFVVFTYGAYEINYFKRVRETAKSR